MHRPEREPQPYPTGAQTDEGTELGFRRGSVETGKLASTGAREAWWLSFQDPELDLLVSASLARNPEIWASVRRIDQAHHRLAQSGSALFPQLTGSGDFQRSWELDGERQHTGELGLNLRWELDVWGRLRSARAARFFEARGIAEDNRAIRLSLTAAVAEAWFGVLEQKGQLELAREQISVNRTLLDLAKVRYGQGQGSVVDVLQQEQQLQGIEALVPDLESRLTEFSLILDELVALPPGTPWTAADLAQRRLGYQPNLPARPPSGYPSDLLRERPDLRAQRARLVALDHEVGEAIADRMPRFAIGGSLAVAGLPTPDTLVGDTVANALAPLFTAGERKAEVRFRRARLAEETDRYSSAFLAAVREVETALVLEDKIGERIARQEAQLRTLRRLLTESRHRYTDGASDYLPVLDALSRVQDLERALLSSRRDRLSARVLLHRALGGPLDERIAAPLDENS